MAMKKVKITYDLYSIGQHRYTVSMFKASNKLTNEHGKQNELVHNPYPGSSKEKKKWGLK